MFKLNFPNYWDFKKIQRRDAYKGFIIYFYVYLDKVTFLKTGLDRSIQPIEPRIDLIKTKKKKKKIDQTKKISIKDGLNQKSIIFFLFFNRFGF